jgi:arylsulfatase A-like enzyme
LGGGSTDWREEAFIQISEAQVGRAIRTDRWKYSVSAPDKDGYRDMGSNRYVEEFLYDVQADPYELTNLIGFESHREVADRLSGRLVALIKAAGEAEPEIVPADSQKDGINRRVFPDRAYPGRDW